LIGNKGSCTELHHQSISIVSAFSALCSCTVEAFEVKINAVSGSCKEGCIEACMEE
jgi:hypothetical protein